jgi:hypothetical protein
VDKDLQKIDEKIDKLATAMEKGFDAVGKRLDVVEETVMFMKDRVATKEDLKKLATKEDADGKFKMLEGHMNVIEQKLDDHIENLKDIPARVTALETSAFGK